MSGLHDLVDEIVDAVFDGNRDDTPASIAAKAFASELPQRRTVDVDAFCSWSACRIMIKSSAFAIRGSGVYSSVGIANIMYRKFSA